jgi:hypothetical protein
MNTSKLNLNVQITSVLTGAAGVIALIHPGFKVPPFVQGLTVTIASLVVTALQFRHLTFKQGLAQAEAFAKASTAAAAAAPAQAAAPVAPQGPQA